MEASHDSLSPLWKDVFLQWKEESHHAVLEEVKGRRDDARIAGSERNAAADDLIALLGAADGSLQAQSVADADCFLKRAGLAFTEAQHQLLYDTLLKAYRWQYIVRVVREPRLGEVRQDPE